MTAQQIINRIVYLHKDQAPGEVVELLASRALVSDLPFIASQLGRTNEFSAMNEALDWIASNES